MSSQSSLLDKDTHLLPHSFAPYALFAYPYDLDNSWPFTEMSILWDKFHPDVSMPKDTRISITYNGQMILSLVTIRKTSRETWKEMHEVLVSDVDDPRHLPGFAWKAEKEG